MLPSNWAFAHSKSSQKKYLCPPSVLATRNSLIWYDTYKMFNSIVSARQSKHTVTFRPVHLINNTQQQQKKQYWPIVKLNERGKIEKNRTHTCRDNIRTIWRKRKRKWRKIKQQQHNWLCVKKKRDMYFWGGVNRVNHWNQLRNISHT